MFIFVKYKYKSTVSNNMCTNKYLNVKHNISKEFIFYVKQNQTLSTLRVTNSCTVHLLIFRLSLIKWLLSHTPNLKEMKLIYSLTV